MVRSRATLTATPATVLVTLVVLSVAFPLLFWYGFTKGLLAAVAAVLAVAVVTGLLTAVILGGPSLLWSAVRDGFDTVHPWGLSWWVGSGVAVLSCESTAAALIPTSRDKVSPSLVTGATRARSESSGAGSYGNASNDPISQDWEAGHHRP